MRIFYISLQHFSLLRILQNRVVKSFVKPHRSTASTNLCLSVVWWIREAVKNRQEGQDIMTRNGGAFLLSHVYEDLLSVATPNEVSSSKKDNSRCRNITKL